MAVQWGRRLLTGLVGIPTALWLLSAPLGMLLLASSLCALCLLEFSGSIAPAIVASARSKTDEKDEDRARDANLLAHRAVLVASGVVACVAASTGSKEVHDLAMFGGFLMLVCFHLAHASSAKYHQAILVAMLLDAFALFFIVNGFTHAILLRSAGGEFGLGLQILGLCCSWICDTGALVMGSAFGSVKLAPTISPGKTVVGAVGGVGSSVATVVVMFGLCHSIDGLHSMLPTTEVVPLEMQIALGSVLGVLCILGDLVESFLKRLAHVKDSGSFFPGHGGCLDRMDSFLFVAPCLYFWTQWFL